MKNKTNNKVYVIAEAGVNHNGNKSMAYQLIDAAVEAGADAVKFQTFQASKLAGPNVKKAQYQYEQTDREESQQEMLKSLELPQSWHHDLQNHAKSQGIEFLSTAFDQDSLRFLNSINLPLFKIPSGELTNGPLIWQFARTGKPLILSTGMANLSEIEQALAIIVHALNAQTEPTSLKEVWQCWSDSNARAVLDNHVTLLHCTSQYPTPWEDVNLKAMDALAAAFQLQVGYSDHTSGVIIPYAAVARGAVLIEKHFTLDRNLPGPDHKASLEPTELKEMIAGIRILELAMGSGIKSPQPCEWETREVVRQSLIATNNIEIGEESQPNHLGTARMGNGLSPVYYWDFIGCRAEASYQCGDLFLK